MKNLIYLLALLLFFSCHQEESTKVEIDVTLHIKDNRTSPLVVAIENNTPPLGVVSDYVGLKTKLCFVKY